MTRTFYIATALLAATACTAQPTSTLVANPDFDQTIRSYIDFSVPIITVDELAENQDSYLLLDAREPDEYEVSHIAGAKYIGFKEFDPSSLQDVPKDKPIVLYCSIGYRSEKTGEKLQELGFTNVKNLYGSIFEWVNRGQSVVDATGKETNSVHAYSKKWGKWIDNPAVEKKTKK